MNLDLLNFLIKLQTITPDTSGNLLKIIPITEKLGFKTNIIKKNNYINLYLVKNEGYKNLCFAGHFDVVDPIDKNMWKNNTPFILNNIKDKLYGRGIVDMKGSFFCFLEAVKNISIEKKTISIILTSDEESSSKNGMPIVIDWLNENKKKIDLCIVGEPTSNKKIGDTIKNGRRGSINCRVKIIGKQGHVAYPEKCINPIHYFDLLIKKLKEYKIDNGNINFEPSNCELVGIKSSSSINNIIPENVEFIFNIRFNNLKKSHEIIDIYNDLLTINSKKVKIEKKFEVSSEPFISKTNEKYLNLVSDSIHYITNIKTEIINNGGTSDARFIHKISPIFELGLKNETAHKINENCSKDDLENLTKIYYQLINRFN